jgi:hypothetical protein
VLSFEQVWRLSVSWYSGRQNAGWKRPAPGEMAALFEGAGLTGDFWKVG